MTSLIMIVEHESCLIEFGVYHAGRSAKSLQTNLVMVTFSDEEPGKSGLLGEPELLRRVV